MENYSESAISRREKIHTHMHENSFTIQGKPTYGTFQVSEMFHDHKIMLLKKRMSSHIPIQQLNQLRQQGRTYLLNLVVRIF